MKIVKEYDLSCWENEGGYIAPKGRDQSYSFTKKKKEAKKVLKSKVRKKSHPNS